MAMAAKSAPRSPWREAPVQPAALTVPAAPSHVMEVFTRVVTGAVSPARKSMSLEAFAKPATSTEFAPTLIATTDISSTELHACLVQRFRRKEGAASTATIMESAQMSTAAQDISRAKRSASNAPTSRSMEVRVPSVVLMVHARPLLVKKAITQRAASARRALRLKLLEATVLTAAQKAFAIQLFVTKVISRTAPLARLVQQSTSRMVLARSATPKEPAQR
mmetsp:Transcript_95057/g.168823  ORF Transcript_95057/g.168823 Transcript_95057/m.168823 type:complete len:221 (-) Transcript_95057:1466-2128(-)